MLSRTGPILKPPYVAAAGASRKIADNIFCVPKGLLDTFR